MSLEKIDYLVLAVTDGVARQVKVDGDPVYLVPIGPSDIVMAIDDEPVRHIQVTADKTTFVRIDRGYYR